MHSTALASKPPVEPITVSIATAKQITGLGHTTVYKLIGEGKLKVIKVGARTLVVYASLKALLDHPDMSA